MNLIRAKIGSEYDSRITAVICLPDIFTNEIYFFRSEDYYQSFTCESTSGNGSSSLIKERSLAEEWGLNLPQNEQELDITLE